MKALLMVVVMFLAGACFADMCMDCKGKGQISGRIGKCEKCKGTGEINQEPGKCTKCNGSGKINIKGKMPAKCSDCKGTGKVSPDACYACNGSGKVPDYPKQNCRDCKGTGIRASLEYEKQQAAKAKKMK